MTAPETGGVKAARDPARLAVLDGYGILDTPAEREDAKAARSAVASAASMAVNDRA